jgi:phospholipid/cholesterol/gamma-HCH transport system permease protein
LVHLSLDRVRSSIPYDPHDQRPEVRGWLAVLGRLGIEGWQFWSGAVRMLWMAVGSAFTPGRAAAGTVRSVTLAQIFFTGAQGLPFITATAIILGATMIIQMRVAAAGMPGEIMGKVLVTVVLRELSPLVTAIIVASRSGTAISTEIGNMKASLEVLGLASMGIDPLRFVVLPRIVAVVVSVNVLIVYFGVMSLAGAFAIGAAFGMPLGAMRLGLADTLGLPDLLLFLGKGIGCGALVAVVCCYFGLQVKSSSTEVPLMTGRAVIRSVLGCVVYNFAATIAFYSTIGSPTGQL